MLPSITKKAFLYADSVACEQLQDQKDFLFNFQMKRKNENGITLIINKYKWGMKKKWKKKIEKQKTRKKYEFVVKITEESSKWLSANYVRKVNKKCSKTEQMQKLKDLKVCKREIYDKNKILKILKRKRKIFEKKGEKVKILKN